MYELDGINISDLNYDKVCLNCKHWQVNVQIRGPADGVICRLGRGHTEPTDICPEQHIRQPAGPEQVSGEVKKALCI